MPDSPLTEAKKALSAIIEDDVAAEWLSLQDPEALHNADAALTRLRACREETWYTIKDADGIFRASEVLERTTENAIERWGNKSTGAWSSWHGMGYRVVPVYVIREPKGEL